MDMSKYFQNLGFSLFFTYIILEDICANTSNDMIVDYFEYRKMSSVVGFSCNGMRDDVALVHQFSIRNIKSTIYKYINNSIMNVIRRNDYQKLGIFLESECLSLDTMEYIFSEATEYRLYGDLNYWLTIGDNLTNVLNMVNDRAFGVSTDFVIAVSNSLNGFELYDLYNVFKERGTILNITFFGEWDMKNRINLQLVQSKISRRSNLRGLVLKVSFYKLAYRKENETVEGYFDSFQNPTKDGRSKFGYHVLKHLSEMYNFNFESFEAHTWLAGDNLGPLATTLVNNSADIAGGLLTMNEARTYLLKFVHQDWPFRTCFIFRNPQDDSVKIQEVLRPFVDIIWNLLILTMIISIIILTVSLRFESNNSNSNFSTVSDSFIITVGSLCQQCTSVRMERLSTRIAFFSLMIFYFLIYDYYSASVVSARLDEPINKINDSLSELSKLDLKIASEAMGYLEPLLEQPDWEAQQFYNKRWLNLEESNKFREPEIGIRLVQKGGFAYHLHPEVGYPFIEKTYSNREICELMEVHLARPVLTAFGVTMNNTIVEIMRIGLTKITEVGVRKRLQLKYQYRKPVCRTDVLTASSVTLDEFAPHLILLLIGIVLAIFIYAVEMIIIKYYSDFQEKSFSDTVTFLKFLMHVFQNKEFE